MTGQERRLLELLAGSPDGATDLSLLAQGFQFKVMLGVIGAGFAAATSERAFAAGRSVEVSRVRITDAGRRVLAEKEHS